MDRTLRERVWVRAGSRCEYCQLSQDYSDSTHEIDHVISEKHHGLTEPDNLALACFACNNHKGPNIAGVEEGPGTVTRLYHPRRDEWADHFRWAGPILVGLTAIGRVTVDVLNVNARHRVVFRQSLIEEGVFPPPPTRS